jgi:O-antigen/teichoic acid export membrane protein
LTGRGYIKQAQKALVIYNFSFIIIAYIGLFLGYGLIAVSFAALISCAIERIILINFFYDDWIKKVMRERKATISEKKEIIKILWYNAKKMGVVSIGSFLINRMGQFFVTSFFSLKIAAQYGLTVQIATFISSSSIIYFNTMYPKMIFDYFKGKIDSVRKEFGLCLIIISLFFLMAGFFIILFGNFSLQLINSKTTLLPNSQMILLFLIFFLEIQHSVAANIITFENKIPFVASALFSGFFIIVFTYILLYFFNPNVWYILLVQFFVQLSYNNWKWPLEASRILKKPYFEIINEGSKQLVINIKLIKWRF